MLVACKCKVIRNNMDCSMKILLINFKLVYNPNEWSKFDYHCKLNYYQQGKKTALLLIAFLSVFRTLEVWTTKENLCAQGLIFSCFSFWFLLFDLDLQEIKCLFIKKISQYFWWIFKQRITKNYSFAQQNALQVHLTLSNWF